VAREALRRAARGGVETKMRRDSIARKKRERWGRGSCCVGGREKREERFLAAWADIIAGAMMKKKRRPTPFEMTMAVVGGGISGIFWCGHGVHDTD
jgi:hypothetical protein